MSKDSKKHRKLTPTELHAGSSADDTRRLGGENDFGIPEKNVIAREYASNQTKLSDPGVSQERSGSQGQRTSGVGGNDSGAGSSSGGDLNPDFTGVGSSGGIAASGKIHEPPGPDDVTASGQNASDGDSATNQ